MSAVAVAISAVALAAPVDQWRKVTVYDVLPEGCRDSISNNDVGNPHGDMYFNIKDKYLPVACAACALDGSCRHSASTFDCDNPESSGNLVVRKIEVEVNGAFDDNGYELCDVWPGSSACQYTCFSPHGRQHDGVGREAVCGGESSSCDMAPTPGSRFTGTRAWDYWNYNTAALFGNTGQGEWYSLVSRDEGTMWRNATTLKKINAACQSRALDKLVQQTGQACFDACPQPTNQSSTCWVDCFFATVLGPDADTTTKPPGSQQGAMDVDQLATAWLSGFGSDDPSEGGCPPCPATGPCPDTGVDAAPSRGRAPRPHRPLATPMVERSRRAAP